MLYYSTRDRGNYATASRVILKGLAPDGGLFVPAENIKNLFKENLPTGNYQELAVNIFSQFLGDFSLPEIQFAVSAAYNFNTFENPAITPLSQVSEQTFSLELWHGPTSAFKDIALQVLPHLLTTAALKSGEKKEYVILTATSGDTGKSALEGFRDVPGVKIMVYFPEKGVSDIQKLQMTTQEGKNVHVIAVRGNFDDTQTGVKQIFNNHNINTKLERAGYRLTSANSINWGRLLPQIVYYFYAYGELVTRGHLQEGGAVNFVVPTGNFGNILAAYYARRLGLPINRLICAANQNNVLSDFINSGQYNKNRPFYNSLSPSMDILVSSNLERLLFELSDHDSEQIQYWMELLLKNGLYCLDKKTLSKLQELFWSDYADDEETLETIAKTYRAHNYLLDPHSAVAKKVLEKYLAQENDNHLSIVLSTASPYKFTGSTIKALYDSSLFKGLSELELMKTLSQKTGIPVPKNLAELEDKQILHHQVIEPQKMPEHLQKLLLN